MRRFIHAAALLVLAALAGGCAAESMSGGESVAAATAAAATATAQPQRSDNAPTATPEAEPFAAVAQVLAGAPGTYSAAAEAGLSFEAVVRAPRAAALYVMSAVSGESMDPAAAVELVSEGKSSGKYLKAFKNPDGPSYYAMMESDANAAGYVARYERGSFTYSELDTPDYSLITYFLAYDDPVKNQNTIIEKKLADVYTLSDLEGFPASEALDKLRSMLGKLGVAYLNEREIHAFDMDNMQLWQDYIIEKLGEMEDWQKAKLKGVKQTYTREDEFYNIFFDGLDIEGVPLTRFNRVDLRTGNYMQGFSGEAVISRGGVQKLSMGMVYEKTEVISEVEKICTPERAAEAVRELYSMQITGATAVVKEISLEYVPLPGEGQDVILTPAWVFCVVKGNPQSQSIEVTPVMVDAATGKIIE